jgi:hypothetical protein
MAIVTYSQRFLPASTQPAAGIYSKRFSSPNVPVSSSSKVSTTFNYSGAFGPDLLEQPSNQISQMIQTLSKSPKRKDYVARPDDPEVGNYMAHILGGQRKLMDQYVKGAANAGIRRGGMNAAGGPAAGSSLHHEAMKTLASDYSNRFSQGMDYNRYVKGTLHGEERNRMNDMQSLFGLQRGYLAARQSRQDRMAEMKRQDWLTSLTKNPVVVQMPTAPAPAPAPKQTPANQEAQLANQRRGELEMEWKQLLHKMDANPYHFSRSDNEKLEYLGTQLGYMTPWKRSFSAINKPN